MDIPREGKPPLVALLLEERLAFLDMGARQDVVALAYRKLSTGCVERWLLRDMVS